MWLFRFNEKTLEVGDEPILALDDEGLRVVLDDLLHLVLVYSLHRVIMFEELLVLLDELLVLIAEFHDLPVERDIALGVARHGRERRRCSRVARASVNRVVYRQNINIYI